eukprot:2496143-Prymnesium_polylepis.3
MRTRAFVPSHHAATFSLGTCSSRIRVTPPRSLNVMFTTWDAFWYRDMPDKEKRLGGGVTVSASK